jgi:gamma-glutamyl-gamma-aminobutyrate hydrolase PuuD
MFNERGDVSVRRAARPIVAVAARRARGDPSQFGIARHDREIVPSALIDQLFAVGLIPVALPISRIESNAFTSVFDLVAGLVLQGGDDIDPSLANPTGIPDPSSPHRAYDVRRDQWEIDLVHKFVNRGKPILGICRGCQLLNVAFGGVVENIAFDHPPHSHRDLHSAFTHEIQLSSGGVLQSAYGVTEGIVNSIHDQAIALAADCFCIEATSVTGVIEAISHISRSQFVVGVQWHPEWLDDKGSKQLPGRVLFNAFADACKR